MIDTGSRIPTDFEVDVVEKVNTKDHAGELKELIAGLEKQ